jgi:hypothetical protein
MREVAEESEQGRGARRKSVRKRKESIRTLKTERNKTHR